jgi:NAD(P)H-dependent flavin oxidoreductase YrpB (nitropropane dioxygenase family)
MSSVTIRTGVCDLLSVECPVVAFTHVREVAAAVSRAGGLGMYGAAYYGPEQVDEDLAWLASNTEGKPFGADVMIPSSSEIGRDGRNTAQRHC